MKLDLKYAPKEARTRERSMVKTAVVSSSVVFCTNIGAAQLQKFFQADLEIENIPFDLLVIDEAVQSLEASGYVPLKYAKRLILVGDHK